MRVTPQSNTLVISLQGIECLYAFRRKIVIPKESISSITWQKTFKNWRPIEFRLPGSFLPGVIIAGSFYAKEGWDFVYSSRPTGWSRPSLKHVLVIETTKRRYRRLIISLPESDAKKLITWYSQ